MKKSEYIDRGHKKKGLSQKKNVVVFLFLRVFGFRRFIEREREKEKRERERKEREIEFACGVRRSPSCG